jgi:hypothetical protein
MPRNFTDKSLWNPANPAINNVNVPTLGEVNSLFAAAGLTIAYGSQDDLGKRIIFSDAEIGTYTYAPNGTLFGGMYQVVQVDAAATAANVAVGKIAFLKQASYGGYVVTDGAHATDIGLIAGVFLNSITPGNYGVICIGGKVNVKFAGALTNGAPAVGDNIAATGAAGLADDLSASSTAPTSRCFGLALAVAAANATSAVWIPRPIFFE